MFRDAKIFEPLTLYSEDGLEMAGSLMMTLERGDCTVTVEAFQDQLLPSWYSNHWNFFSSGLLGDKI